MGLRPRWSTTAAFGDHPGLALLSRSPDAGWPAHADVDSDGLDGRTKVARRRSAAAWRGACSIFAESRLERELPCHDQARRDLTAPPSIVPMNSSA